MVLKDIEGLDLEGEMNCVAVKQRENGNSTSECLLTVLQFVQLLSVVEIPTGPRPVLFIKEKPTGAPRPFRRLAPQESINSCLSYPF